MSQRPQEYGPGTGVCVRCGRSRPIDQLEPGPWVDAPMGGFRRWACRQPAECEAVEARNQEVKEVQSAKFDARIPRGMLSTYSKPKEK